jgi:hypothetical protein
MRPSRGLPLNIRVALYTILIGLLLGATSRVSHAQATSTLPKSWNDAAAKLADEVAAAMSPTAVTLDVENISSLDVSFADAIEAAVRTQLQRHSFSLAPENSAVAQAAVRMQLSLSESAAEYVWVMQILNDQSDGAAAPVMIVAAPKADFADAGAEAQSLSLGKRFVWKQTERFLDFALSKDASSGELTLLVLGTSRLTTYKPAGSQWQLSRTSPIPQAAPPSRDPQGTINLKEGKISVKGFECVGDPDLGGVVRCSASKPIRSIGGIRIEIPGFPTSLGTDVKGWCRGEFVFLFTAEGDWTQNDSIRGRLTKGIPLPFVASGNPIEFDGPVMSLKPEPETSAARVVVRNLKTGEYEGYIVTATCGN